MNAKMTQKTTKVFLMAAIVSFIALFSLDSTLEAYNFLYIHPTTGEPVKWDNAQTIQYYLDPGPLGRLSNEQLHTLLKEAMKIWENASSSAGVPKFEFAGYLPEDVNETNYQKYVTKFACYTDDLASCETEAQKNLQTVMVFDEDNAILNSGSRLCGLGSCGAVAGARVFEGDSSDPISIKQGMLLLGLRSGSAETRISSVVGVMVHELGHLLGLAHSSVDQQIFIEDLENQDHYMPTMFSRAADASESTLHPDDIAGITALYPSDTASSETATIKGEILKSDGSPMMHVNVIARNIDDPLCEAVSFLSGRQCHPTDIVGTCLLDENDTGRSEYIIGLPPGSYTLEVEEVADDSLAFTLAPGLVDPFIFGDSEFWNESDAAGESNTTSSVITLAAGETRENVDIILNRSEVTEDRVKYIPLDTFTPGPGTRCPEEPPIDYAKLIGIEESDDSNSTDTGDSSPPSGGCSLVR